MSKVLSFLGLFLGVGSLAAGMVIPAFSDTVFGLFADAVPPVFPEEAAYVVKDVLLALIGAIVLVLGARNVLKLGGGRPMSWLGALHGNLLIAVVFVYFAILQAHYPETFHWSIQEDEYLEWGTVWAFLGAAALCVVGAFRQWRGEKRIIPWFLAGLSLFCFLVAMEEISWGQRILGYRPPAYFLENNFQQEFNVHNVVSTSDRKLTLRLIIIAYGMVLPLLALVPPLRRLMDRLGVVAPPPALIPGFVMAFAVYHDYPFGSAGEVVETMLGLGFLFAAVDRLPLTKGTAAPGTAGLRSFGMLSLAWVGVLLLGLASAAGSRSIGSTDPVNLQAAQKEVEALKADFRRIYAWRYGRLYRIGGLHKRVYSYLVKYGTELEAGDLRGGRFTPESIDTIARAILKLDPKASEARVRAVLKAMRGVRIDTSRVAQKVVKGRLSTSSYRRTVEALRRVARGLDRRKAEARLRSFKTITIDHAKDVQYSATYLKTGAFAQLTAIGLAPERAEYFLDPWNSPYWISKERTDDGEYTVVMVYSFGPNRRRESTDWEILGDDVGAIILEIGDRPDNLVPQ